VATLLIFHEVDDVDRWLHAPTREELFGPLGISARRFVDPDHPNRVGLMVDVSDPEAFRRVMASPEAIAAMTADGVRRDTVVTLVEA
jgi:hypothetical protein